jgi:hypothetical protein
MSKQQHVGPTMHLKMKWQDAAYRVFIGVNAILFTYLTLQIPWNYFQFSHNSGIDISCCLSAGTYTLAIACCLVAASALLILIRKN